MFKCPGTYCIPTRMLCDDNPDCPDSDDERMCVEFQCAGLLKCRGDQICVHPVDICDGIVHCLLSADDEHLCEIQHCPPSCVCRGTAFHCTDVFSMADIPDMITELILERHVIRSETPFQYKTNLLHLKINNSSFIGNIVRKHTFNKLSNIIILILTNSKLHWIQMDSFLSMTVLNNIDLRGNHIHYLLSYMFQGLMSMIHLNLSRFTLRSIQPYSFYGLSNLEYLNLSDNALFVIKQTTFTGLHNIKVIDLNRNTFLAIEHLLFGHLNLAIYVDSIIYCCNLDPNQKCLGHSHVQSHVTVVAHCRLPKPNPVNMMYSTVIFSINIGLLYKIQMLKKIASHKRLLIQLSLTSMIFSAYIIVLGAFMVLNKNRYIYLNTTWHKSYICYFLSSSIMVAFLMSKFIMFSITLNQLLVVKYVYIERPMLMSYIVYCVWLILIPAVIILQFFIIGYTDITCFPYLADKERLGNPLILTVFSLCLTLILTILTPSMYYSIIKHVKLSNSKVANTKAKRNQIVLIRKAIMVTSINMLTWLPITVLTMYSYSISYQVKYRNIAVTVHTSEILHLIYLLNEIYKK